MPRDLKVFFICTGTGIYNRGVESFFCDAYSFLPPLMPDVNCYLFKGGGQSVPERNEHRVWCLPRTGRRAAALGRLVRRSPAVVEQLTFLPGLVRHIRRERPDVLYHSSLNLAMRLWRHRDRIGVPYRMLFSNGLQAGPPFIETDHVQHATPYYYDLAIAAGEPRDKHSLVPLGIHVPEGNPADDPQRRAQLRRELGLPADRPIVISVGAIGTDTAKRMPYTVSEVAQLPPERRPFLLLLGAFEGGADRVEAQMHRQLGAGNFAMRSVPLEQVRSYYQASDVFALASLQEGFGRVYLEALIEGLPCVVHDGPVMRYVLGEQAVFADLAKKGALAAALINVLSQPQLPTTMAARRQSVRDRFDWRALAPQYAQMFYQCAGQPQPTETPLCDSTA